ncbi:MAG: HlyD family type I secretion periplasmic adaptor subunit [Geminicoccaceae bacterium]|nr:HlyD family type I secretion periplasmic adaptor subunit [Geminicoccaceae bacterium]MDW8371972.1 HlyD family type I secretion periplasmic adaptor subunit [Geminicoccaceae bacterium]
MIPLAPRERRRAGEAAALGAALAGESLAIARAPLPPLAGATIWLVALLLATVLVLGTALPIERVVSARGRIVAQGPTIVVQPLETAVLRALHVREGDRVQAGALLATLDPTFPSADASQLERRRAFLAAEVERLEAELAGRRPVVDPAEPASVLQAEIFEHRAAEQRAVIERYDERIRASEAALARVEADAGFLRTRLALSSEIEQMRIRLEDNRTGSRLSRLIATDGRVEVARNLAAASAAATTLRHELDALRAERETAVRQWSSRIAEQLAARRLELAAVGEELAKAVRRRELVELRAPEPGIVLEVARLAPGAVLRSGERIATLVPAVSALEVEVELAAIDQPFVEPGDPARLKFDALRHLRHGTAEGRVRSVSADGFTRHLDDRPSPAVLFRARIDLERFELKDLPEAFRPIPGMPLTAEIVVGSRTPIAYFLEGALRGVVEGFREP